DLPELRRAASEGDKWAPARQAALLLRGELELDEVHASAAGGRAGTRAQDDLALHAFLCQDLPRLRASVATLGGAFGALWSAVTEGESMDAADAAFEEARGADDAIRAIDAMALRALHALDSGDAEAALRIARQASRMAASEGVIQREYFANLVLARARRYVRQTAAALRILHDLEQVVSGPWHAWVEWELMFGGGSVPGARSRWANALQRQLQEGSAAAGPRTLCAGFANELEHLGAALDPASPPGDDWARGTVSDVHPSLSGFLVPQIDGSGKEVASAYVVAHPEPWARRILSQGLHRTDGGATATAFNLSARRTHVALATLALAHGASMHVHALFEAVYGFPFVVPKHQGTFRGLLHRMRAELPEFARIEREADVCRLITTHTLVLPDPRCAPDLEQTVLRLLGKEGTRLTSDAIARQLAVPLRTVQRALRDLVDVGSCEVVAEGRRSFYRIEDTTFSEPTLTRLRASR
ncbi:MAG: hypothetical protein AAF411_23585, partial [Myxococcota bacterium]